MKNKDPNEHKVEPVVARTVVTSGKGSALRLVGVFHTTAVLGPDDIPDAAQRSWQAMLSHARGEVSQVDTDPE
jgi:hypothetical protein